MKKGNDVLDHLGARKNYERELLRKFTVIPSDDIEVMSIKLADYTKTYDSKLVESLDLISRRLFDKLGLEYDALNQGLEVVYKDQDYVLLKHI